MQVSYSSLFVCFDLYPRHIAPALMLQRTPPQADQDRKDEPVFGAGILSRLRCKTAFLSRQKHDVKSGAFPLSITNRDGETAPGACFGMVGKEFTAYT